MFLSVIGREHCGRSNKFTDMLHAARPKSNLPIQVRKIASIKNLQADTVDDFCVFLAGSKLVIGHEAEQDCDECLDADQAQILPE